MIILLIYHLLTYNPYLIRQCHLDENDTIYAQSSRSAIDIYMKKWWPVIGHSGPYCLVVNEIETHEVMVNITFKHRRVK